MGDIAREEMGNASSLFNLMRNVGSSVGIAVITTVLAHRRVVHSEVLSSHINPYSPLAMERLAAMQAYFRSRGSDSTTALQQAYTAFRGMVARQAAMLSFIDAFYLMGVIFLVLIPLLFIMRRPRAHGPAVAAVE